MHDVLSNGYEIGRERFPTEAEVRVVFERVLGERKFEQVRKREDEQGLYLWDVKVEEERGFTEYSYMRKGQYPEGAALETAVHVVFFNEESVPVGGHAVAKFKDGKWELDSN